MTHSPNPRWSRYATILAVALIIGAGAFFGIKRAGEAMAARIPDLSLPEVSVGEAVDAVVTPTPYEQLSPAVISSIQGLAELTTVEYVEYTTIEKGSDDSWLRWARGDGITLFAVAEIGAGIELDALTSEAFSVDPATGVVTVTLPEATILYSALDNEETRVFDRSTGLFTDGDDQLESEARSAAEAFLVDEAITDGILTDARRNAGDVLTRFLLSLGYPGVEIAPAPAGG